MNACKKLNEMKLKALVDRDSAKRPVKVSMGAYSVWQCPSCKRMAAQTEFCPHCGQRIKWKK